MKLRDLLTDVPLQGRYDPELDVRSVCTDGQEDLCGTLFVEVPESGLTAAQALAKGAFAAVGAAPAPGVLVSADCWQTLSSLGRNWYCRPGDGMVLAAVVGNRDAELTVQLLRAALEAVGGVHLGIITPRRVYLDGVELPEGQRVPGGLCVHRLLRRMADLGCTHVVLQMDDATLARREYAGLHLSVAALTDWRPEYARMLCAADLTVLNLDERGWQDCGGTLSGRILTYSENKGAADVLARNLRLFPGHMEFEAVATGRIRRIHLPAPGGFTVYHGLCALACGLCLGLDLDCMARALRCAKGAEGCMEVLPVPAPYTVVRDRASDPAELERVLTAARKFTAGRLLCLVDCPAGDPRLRPQVGAVAEQLADGLVLTGRCPKALEEVLSGLGSWRRPYAVEADRACAVRRVLSWACPGDVIVLSGCRDGDRAERELIRACVRPQPVGRRRA